jgi:beta-mannosidase
MEKKSLNGHWVFKEFGSEEELTAVVPGCVHTDLINNEKIPDPFIGLNELDLQWIDSKDWVYRKEFEVSESFVSETKQELVCEGIDTVSTLKLNGREIGKTENMFRRYIFDLSGVLEKGKNILEVHLHSPTAYAEAESQKIDHEIPGSEYHWNSGEERITHRNQIRKAQYQFGWDWAPCLITSGIWKDIFIVAQSSPAIRALTSEVKLTEGQGELHLDLFLDLPQEQDFECEFVLKSPDNQELLKSSEQYSSPVGEMKIKQVLNVENPQLWYPNGYGDQPLYELTVSVKHGNEILDSVSRKIGFREFELVTEPDEIGESFYFKVNGIPVYAKGANWVPADSFPSRLVTLGYRRLIQEAANANMNMLRVWGGGIYEHDAFYELCDEYGIMVWQDFMFACCAYPGSNDFLRNVADEARYQVRRLKSHASLTLWCGDNENVNVAKVWKRSEEHGKLLAEDYRKLQEALALICREEDPSGIYRASSPWPGSLDRGDEHFWAVGQNRVGASEYLNVIPRFCSEFGFQGFPDYHTLEEVIAPESMNISSPEMENHQRKRPHWNGLLLDYICSEYWLPDSLSKIALASQLQQAEAIKLGVEHWRRNKPRNMGALYWQFNDCWQCISWAGIDYRLRRKALQYFAVKFFAPVLLSMEKKDDAVDVCLSSDVNRKQDGLVLCEVWSTNGELLYKVEMPFELDPLKAQKIQSIPMEKILADGITKEKVIIRSRLLNCEYYSENTLLLVAPKYLRLTDPKLKVTALEDTIELTADKPTLSVYLFDKSGKAEFSDNFFHVFPNEKVVVKTQNLDGSKLEYGALPY